MWYYGCTIQNKRASRYRNYSANTVLLSANNYITGESNNIMEQSEKDSRLGRFLSLVLRHNPSAAGITLDKNGWADVEQLLLGAQHNGWDINRQTLERIVRENNKSRYSFNEDQTKIRANQGHSLAVDVELKAQTPPDILYHGTATRFLASIMENGLTRQSRQHVHLSANAQTAANVGTRHGKPVILCGCGGYGTGWVYLLAIRKWRMALY